MIAELRKKMARELTLVLAERGRIEETALPTDLWKRPVSNRKVSYLGILLVTHIIRLSAWSKSD
jgi:ABC-type histidine transport system ATPase subunit